MKIFNLLKKLFNVQSVDEISEELIDNYYTNLEKTEETPEEETVEEEKTEEVVENAEPEPETEEKVEEVIEETKTETEEKVEEVIEETEPETTETKEEVEEEEVLTREIINSAKGNVPMNKADLMSLHGDQFFSALYKNRKNLM